MRQNTFLRSIGIGLAIIVAIIVYAYGFTVTDVNFETTRSEDRLTQLTRILRALTHPDIFEYEQEEQDVEVPIYLPCPEGGAPEIQPDSSGPYLVLTPACGDAEEFIQVEGFNLWPNTQGPVNFMPPSGATLTIGSFTTDSEGHFQIGAKLPNRQPVAEAQAIRATARRNIGAPYFSPLAKATGEKILETVFLALLATTFGTFLAVPLSFIAAKNLMDEVKSPLTSVALTILGWPLGILLGGMVSGWIAQATESLAASTALSWGSVIVSPVAIWAILTRALPQETERAAPSNASRIGRTLAISVAGVTGVLFLYMLAHLALSVGDSLIDPLGSFGFLGNFVYQLGDSLRMLTPVLVALAAGGTLGGLGGRLGQQASDRLTQGVVRSINLFASALAGAVVCALIGAGIDWFYQIQDLVKTLWIPAGVGAAIGVILALRARPRRPLPIGTTVYYIVRTILNATRSVEPLVMVIVFVVWVGIGPFAGALALGLHTVAALAKLFSEQVESILTGPLEAVQATGANRLQTIVYAVVPQIVPPYISFLMYRWDINVRMSTIIGFAGGGGIGFLLQQNIRLLDYRAASTQMLAIAVVVASMDYISSTLRQRFV